MSYMPIFENRRRQKHLSTVIFSVNRTLLACLLGCFFARLLPSYSFILLARLLRFINQAVPTAPLATLALGEILSVM